MTTDAATGIRLARQAVISRVYVRKNNSGDATQTRASPTTKRPISTKSLPIPSARSSAPMVNRTTPEFMSVPTVASSRPRRTMPAARKCELCASAVATASSSAMSATYSAGPKEKATAGAKRRGGCWQDNAENDDGAHDDREMERMRAPDRRTAPKPRAKEEQERDDAKQSRDHHREGTRSEPGQGTGGVTAGKPEGRQAGDQQDDAERAIRDPAYRVGLEPGLANRPRAGVVIVEVIRR